MIDPRPDQVVDPWTGRPRPRRPIVSFPLKVLWSAVAVLSLWLLVGFLLSGRWEVRRTATVSAPPAAVFALVDDPRRWSEWAPLGEIPATFSGPERGPGATRIWDDPAVGDGVFTIVSAVPDREVTYRVEVQKGKMKTEGTMQFEPEGGGTRLVWTERGDFGRNPLLGYIARTMDRTQGTQMEAALGKLRERASTGR